MIRQHISLAIEDLFVFFLAKKKQSVAVALGPFHIFSIPEKCFQQQIWMFLSLPVSIKNDDSRIIGGAEPPTIDQALNQNCIGRAHRKVWRAQKWQDCFAKRGRPVADCDKCDQM